MEANAKKWRGPFDLPQLREEAKRKQFSKDLHEVSEDRLNWRSAKEIWSLVFPKGTGVTVRPAQVAASAVGAAESAPEEGSYSLPKQGREGWDHQNTAEVGEAQAPTSEVETFDWHCLLNGEQYGPFPLSQMRSLITQNQLQPADLVWCLSFDEQWVEAQLVPDLAAVFASAGLIELLPDDGAAGSFNPNATPPLALASFVLSLLGATLFLGIGSILAVVFGHMALAEFQHNRSLKKGRGLAVAGVVIGYTTIGLLVIAGVVYLALKSGGGAG